MIDSCKLPGVYPVNLLGEGSPTDGDRKWWVVYTRSRQEKALGRDLLAAEIPYYLPLVHQTKVYGRKRIKTLHPLFTNYLFLFGSDDERVKSLTTNRISQVLPVPNVDQLVSDLRQLQVLIESNAPLTIERRIQPGQRVRVKYGQLADLEGTVINRRGETRLLISVDFLQQGASLVIEDYCLEPLD